MKKMKADQRIPKGILVLNVFLPYIQGLSSGILHISKPQRRFHTRHPAPLPPLQCHRSHPHCRGGPVAPWLGDFWSFCGSVKPWCAKQSWHQKNVKKNRENHSLCPETHASQVDASLSRNFMPTFQHRFLDESWEGTLLSQEQRNRPVLWSSKPFSTAVFFSGSWWYDHFLVLSLQQSWCRLERPFRKGHTLYQVFRSLLWEATIFNFHSNWRKFMVLCCTRSPFTAEPISKLINKPPRRVVDHRKSHKLRCPAHLETDIKEHQEQQEWERKRSGTSGLSSLPTKF